MHPTPEKKSWPKLEWICVRIELVRFEVRRPKRTSRKSFIALCGPLQEAWIPEKKFSIPTDLHCPSSYKLTFSKLSAKWQTMLGSAVFFPSESNPWPINFNISIYLKSNDKFAFFSATLTNAKPHTSFIKFRATWFYTQPPGRMLLSAFIRGSKNYEIITNTSRAILHVDIN